VHYPGDVLGGAIFGLTVGSSAMLIFRHLTKRLHLNGAP
jgi:membrane-associated phospholipid phosphatase